MSEETPKLMAGEALKAQAIERQQEEVKLAIENMHKLSSATCATTLTKFYGVYPNE